LFEQFDVQFDIVDDQHPRSMARTGCVVGLGQETFDGAQKLTTEIGLAM